MSRQCFVRSVMSAGGGEGRIDSLQTEERRGQDSPADCSPCSLLAMAGSSLSALPVEDILVEDQGTSYSYIFHFEQVGLIISNLKLETTNNQSPQCQCYF